MHFEALRVGRGDAFFLQDGEYSFLFDGGEFINQASTFLSNRGVSRLNAVICSHNDSDHANGVIGILNSTIPVDEVWVPATWGTFLSIAAQKDFWPLDLLTELIDDVIRKKGDNNIEFRKSNNTISENVLTGFVERIIRSYNNKKLSGLGSNSSPSVFHWSKVECFYDLLIAGDRIIQIINDASKKGSRIRMFEYLENGNPNGTKIDKFNWIPLNSLESFQVQSKNFSISYVLGLTIQNEESLVFKYSHEDSSEILFTADSDLSFSNSQILLKNGSLVTVPHHGSAENRIAYTKIKGNNLSWVRSDSKCQRRPCREYKNQKNRYCTICNPANQHKQSVCLQSNGNWQPMNNTRICACK